jgi:hypothetical protein
LISTGRDYTIIGSTRSAIDMNSHIDKAMATEIAS